MTQPKDAKALTDEGWVFRYEPATLYVGLFHPRGGRMSVLHFSNRETGKQYGHAIASFLNGIPTDIASGEIGGRE